MLDELLEFWFGDIKDGLSPAHKKKIWYFSTEENDRDITQKFGELHRLAAAGELDEWQHNARGTLGLIILLDQLSRNIFRGSAHAFAYDNMALRICLTGIAKDFPAQLSLIEQIFFYHPLEHSESLEYQELCVKLFREMSQRYKGEQQDLALNAYQYACEHRDIIAQFGRFPHRNSALGRGSTPEEEAYLNSGGKRFGQ